ncbi:porin family protein [Vibrio nereis]|uniref:porin family protein n=1 Tax=Vibrio nereis TaxID=693 RepID=UPI002494860C|nr:porin family protein [Vibrio nereis]
MINKSSVVIAASTLLISSFTSANSTFEQHGYIGLGYAHIDVDLDVGAQTFAASNGMLGLIAGYKFHPNFGAELRGYGNISDDELLGYNLKLDNSFSFLGKVSMPIWKYMDLYGLVGLGKMKTKVSYLGGSVSDSDTDMQYGVGAAFNKGQPLELQFEWMQIYDDHGIDANSYNVNLVFKI